ncbi:hypothetical protein [Ruminococcus flavefaciens]|uniref:hypothetical protein n=1 Tax=Ruminococcus flavefaciens TaxID=1265 RepID=UPI0026EA4EF8|nr:hypothetical protein [Ruminococcus flavefaciens]
MIFFIKGKIHERRPWYDADYFDDLKTDAVLEKKYSGRGSFETACTEFKSDNSRIDTIRVFYPAELANQYLLCLAEADEAAANVLQNMLISKKDSSEQAEPKSIQKTG